jgi:ankyrin repeat protein
MNEQSSLGDTALHRSAYMGTFGVIKELIAAGVDMKIQNKEGDTALDDAIRGEEKRCAEYMYQHGARPNKKTWPSDWEKSD